VAFGFCYDPARRCTGSAQPGTRVLRDTMDAEIPDLGDDGIYNCRNTRGGSSLSLHAEGRAWDAHTSYKALNLQVAQFCVDAAPMLGVQRVISWDREWDSRPGQRWWSPYHGVDPHHGHDHIELCWAAARDLKPATVRAALDRYWDGARRQEAEVIDLIRTPDRKVYAAVHGAPGHAPKGFKIHLASKQALEAQGFSYAKVRGVKANDPHAQFPTYEPS